MSNPDDLMTLHEALAPDKFGPGMALIYHYPYNYLPQTRAVWREKDTGPKARYRHIVMNGEDLTRRCWRLRELEE